VWTSTFDKKMNPQLTVTFALIAVVSCTHLLGQDLDVRVKPAAEDRKDEIELSDAYVLLGLLNRFPLRNATELEDSMVGHFYQNQREQYLIARHLLAKILEDEGFKGKFHSGKSQSWTCLYSAVGVKILNQMLTPVGSGAYHEVDGIMVERILNDLDLSPRPPSGFFEDEEPWPAREVKLSLVAGFLLREESDGELHAIDSVFTRKMLEFLLLEGCEFDDFRVHDAIPRTIHLRLTPSQSMAPVLKFVAEQRLQAQKNGVEQDAAMKNQRKNE